MQVFNTLEDMVKSINNQLQASRDEFVKYLPAGKSIDFESFQNTILSVTLNKAQQNHLGVNIKQIKIFYKNHKVTNQPHDFICQIHFKNNTNVAFTRLLSKTANVDYKGDDQGADFLTQVLATLVLNANQGDLPGFYIWDFLVKEVMSKKLSQEEQVKLHNILD